MEASSSNKNKGPLPNHDFAFVIIDYFSRYQETKFVRRITSSEIIGIWRKNGRQFVSGEFKSYCLKNNIDLITSPPYCQGQANGKVENMNKSILKRLQIAHGKGIDYKKEVQKFTLMNNELLLNRTITDKIPSVQDVSEAVLDSEARDLDKINKQSGKKGGIKIVVQKKEIFPLEIRSCFVTSSRKTN